MALRPGQPGSGPRSDRPPREVDHLLRPGVLIVAGRRIPADPGPVQRNRRDRRLPGLASRRAADGHTRTAKQVATALTLPDRPRQPRPPGPRRTGPGSVRIARPARRPACGPRVSRSGSADCRPVQVAQRAGASKPAPRKSRSARRRSTATRHLRWRTTELAVRCGVTAANCPSKSSAYSAAFGALTGFGSDIQDLGVVDMSTTFSILLVIAAVRVAPS